MAKVDIPSPVSQPRCGFLGWPDTLTAKHSSGSDSLSTALGAVLEGLTFYEFAHLIAADTRVKVTFEDLQRRKTSQLKRLEPLVRPTAKDAAPQPGIFPLDSVSKAECYVCGHVVETKALPSQCPKCGTARYTFEKEIALTKAWEVAGDAARKSAVLFRDLAAQTSGQAKSVLEELAREEDDLAREADHEIADLRR